MKRISLVIFVLILTICAMAVVGCAKKDVNYTVSFDYDFGINIDKTIVKEGSVVEPKGAIEREGYVFEYWALDGEAFDFATPITGNITLKAVWRALKPIDVVVDGNTSRVYLEYKPSYALSDFDIAKEGAQFTGFYVDNSGIISYVDLSKGLDDGVTIYAEFLSDGVSIEQIEGKDEMAIVDYEGSSQDIILPHFYEGKPITKIGTNAFNKAVINSMKLPRGITTIDEGAFSQITTSNFVVPRGVKTIGDYAFANSKIANFAFEEGSLCESIGDYAFSFVDGIRSIKLPSGVKSLTKEMFSYCETLERVYIPNSVTLIENYTFFGCKNLTTIYRQNELDSVSYILGPYYNYKYEPSIVGSNITANVVLVANDSEAWQ